MQALIPNKLSILNDSVPENEAPLWSAATAYAQGDSVIDDDHYIYTANAANTNKKPSENCDVEGAPWRTISVTNKYACIDLYNSTQTIAPEGTTELVIQVPFARPATGFGLLNMAATELTAVITDADDQVVWESGTVPLLEDVASIWEYCFDPLRYVEDYTTTIPITELAFIELPPRAGTLTITLTGGRPAIGTIVVGEVVRLGKTQYGPTFGFKDYSIATTDDYGNPVYVERKKAKEGTFEVYIDPKDIDYVQRRVMDIGKRPTLWIGDDGAGNGGRGFQSMIIFGRLREYSPVLTAYSMVRATFDIEGYV